MKNKVLNSFLDAMSSERNFSKNTLVSYASDLKKFEKFQLNNNVKIIETAATGANITGNLTLSDIAFTDNNITTTRSNDELILNPNGTGNIVADGHVRLTVQSGNPTADTSSGYVFAKTDTNTEVHVMDGAGNVTKISPHNDCL